jgi:hypothetical protein
MGIFGRLFGGRNRPAVPAAGKRYAYLTGNDEAAIRINRGEPLPAVMKDIKRMWTPGREYLWDAYEVESLIDTDERRQMAVNQLLYARVTVYRALRSRGRDVKGLDPFRYALEVPEVADALAAKFPEMLQGGQLFRRMDVRPKQPPVTGRDVARGDPAVLEGVVRQAVGDFFRVDPAAVDMNRPLSDSPCRAEGLDLMELGSEIMERLEIPIPEDRWEKFLDDEAEITPIRLTPSGLVRLFQEVARGAGEEE